MGEVARVHRDWLLGPASGAILHSGVTLNVTTGSLKPC